MRAGALGLVRKTTEQIWIWTGFCLMRDTPTLGGSSIYRRVSMCCRLKDHGRDTSVFSE